MDLPPLKEVEDLLSKFVNLENRSVIDQKLTRLTKPGENYGSLMLAIEITLKDKRDGKEEILYTVGKRIPPNDFLQQYFNTQVTFRNEIEFYRNVIPAIQEFQKENDMEPTNVFPKCYGARYNLNGDLKVDLDAVLLLENLKLSGYTTAESGIGFDLQAAELIVKEFANFHSATIALKLTQPEVFQSKIRNHVGGFGFPDEQKFYIINAWKEVLQENKETAHLTDRIVNTLKLSKDKPREPYATLTHEDGWVNNIMIQYENKKVKRIKLVDFQVCNYGSPFSDLIFFLFSSVQTKVLTDNYDSLIKLYIEQFSKVLTRLNCMSPQFSAENLMKELNTEAISTFFHVAFMVFPIFADKSLVAEMSDLDIQNFLVGKINSTQKEKIWFYAKEFARRNWLI